MINSIQGGAAAYARLRPLLAPPPPLSGEPTRACFLAGHIAGINDLVLEPPAVPAEPVAVSLQNVTFRYPAAPALREHLSRHPGRGPGSGHRTRGFRQKRVGPGATGLVPVGFGSSAAGWRLAGRNSRRPACRPHRVLAPGPLSLLRQCSGEHPAWLGGHRERQTPSYFASGGFLGRP